MDRPAYNTRPPDQRDSTLGQLFVSIIVPTPTTFECLVGGKITLTVTQVMIILTFCLKKYPVGKLACYRVTRVALVGV
jgi:hypothetical protein